MFGWVSGALDHDMGLDRRGGSFRRFVQFECGVPVCRPVSPQETTFSCRASIMLCSSLLDLTVVPPLLQEDLDIHRKHSTPASIRTSHDSSSLEPWNTLDTVCLTT